MMDELFDRGYQAGRAELNSGLGRTLARLASETRTAFHTLNRLQWSAPWAARPAPRKDIGCA